MLTESVTIKSNQHERPLYALVELSKKVMLANFDYLEDAWHDETDEAFTLRFFKYRGSWYDYHEFQLAPDSYQALGWNGVQPESYFSTVLVRYFDRDGNHLDESIVVGYAHW